MCIYISPRLFIDLFQKARSKGIINISSHNITIKEKQPRPTLPKRSFNDLGPVEIFSKMVPKGFWNHIWGQTKRMADINRIGGDQKHADVTVKEIMRYCGAL